MKLYIDSVGRVNRSELVLKRGDELELCLVFTDCAGNVVPSPWAGVVFGAKGSGEYEGAFLIYAEDFAAGVTCDGEVCLRGRLSLASSALGSLLGEGNVLCLMGEFEFSDLNCTVSSQLLSVRVYNDVIRGNEGTVPGDVTPVYALKSYVDGIAGKLVGETMAEHVRLLGDLVDEAKSAEVDAELARDGAEAAKNTAGEKAVSAMNSAEDAAEALASVRELKVSVDGASVRVAQNATLATEMATSAAMSAAVALEARDAAQSVADSLGSEVDDARQAAVAAAASAASAGQSAAEAKTEVAKIGDSVAEAEAAASQAAASATQAGTARDAAVIAKTAAEAAADRAEAAEGGITQGELDAALAQKLDQPEGGTVGQILTKTESGQAWGDPTGSAEFDGNMSGKELKWESDYAVFLRITPYGMVLDRGNFLDVYRKDYGFDPFYSGTSNSYAPLRMYRDRDGGNDFEEAWLSDNKSVANVGMVKALTGEVDLSDISSSAVKIISGSSVTIQNDSYVGLDVTPEGDTTVSAVSTLTLVDSSGSSTLEDLARIGYVRYVYSPHPQSAVSLADWRSFDLPGGWYKVEVLLHSPAYVEFGGIIRSSLVRLGRIRSVQAIMYGGSGVPYYCDDSSFYEPDMSDPTCRIAQLNFLYQLDPAKGIDWMEQDGLTKFYGGSVRYTAVNAPELLSLTI